MIPVIHLPFASIRASRILRGARLTIPVIHVPVAGVRASRVLRRARLTVQVIHVPVASVRASRVLLRCSLQPRPGGESGVVGVPLGGIWVVYAALSPGNRSERLITDAWLSGRVLIMRLHHLIAVCVR